MKTCKLRGKKNYGVKKRIQMPQVLRDLKVEVVDDELRAKYSFVISFYYSKTKEKVNFSLKCFSLG